tara:strand:+ start:25 stop:336 length:312 start_codon:yes stop_codon:yes gene_type:complete
MPAKSKQQQKFFGVVKAMQSGDIPKKGEAGDVAKDMSKKEVDKYASTKHKGLPKKVKREVLEKIKALTSEQKRKLREKLVFYKDKEGRLRRFDTDSSANKKYS